MLQCNIINVIFVEDCNHFYFYSLGGSCQNLRVLCRDMGKHASSYDVTLYPLTFEVIAHGGDAGRRTLSTYYV